MLQTPFVEMNIRVDHILVEWLASLGYNVTQASRKALRAMFAREAAQWGLTPQALSAMIHEDYGRIAESARPPQPPVWRSVTSMDSAQSAQAA
ncbi:MAG: hypothetical protein RhofKO_17710 [Rhodothermales bacterium]